MNFAHETNYLRALHSLQRTCMGKRPCQAKKKEVHRCGLEYQSTMHDRMAVANAVMVRAACAASVPQNL